MYETVSPILYHSPIVQNLGLFIEGIQHPYESRSAPYHKIDLLSKVKNLTIIHASSPVPIKSPRLSILDDGSALDPDAVDSFMVDRLGRSDLESWKFARVLSNYFLDISNMCRFPEDVMRRIIFFVQQPLPTPDQTDVTWEHLDQKGLSTMMRVCRVRPPSWLV